MATRTTRMAIRFPFILSPCPFHLSRRGFFHFLGCDSVPQQANRHLNAFSQRVVASQRPEQQRSKDGLPPNLRDFFWRKVRAYLTALLPMADQLSQQPAVSIVNAQHLSADGHRREIGLQQRA